jgi:hypothetical protein
MQVSDAALNDRMGNKTKAIRVYFRARRKMTDFAE